MSNPIIYSVVLGLALGLLYFIGKRNQQSVAYENDDRPSPGGSRSTPSSSSGEGGGDYSRKCPDNPFNDECPICLNRVTREDDYILSCGHRLHSVCAIQFHERKCSACPICRKKV